MLLLVLKTKKSIPTKGVELIFTFYVTGWQKKFSNRFKYLFSSCDNVFKGTIPGHHNIHVKMPTLKEHVINFNEPRQDSLLLQT